MDAKLNKYYNHIVDYMFKHVEFHYDEEGDVYFHVKLMPIWVRTYPSEYDFYDFVNDWDEHLIEVMGARPEDMKVLRKRFLNRIKREYY
jgi:hypothetical protein